MKLISKTNIKYLLLIVIVILIFTSIVKETKSEPAPEPILYDFYNDVILDIDKENKPNYYNIKQQQEYNGNYIAYKSFDDTIENVIDFDDSVLGATLEISDYLGHSNVINATSYSSDINTKFSINFYNHSVFYISFWFCASNLESGNLIYFYILNDINLIYNEENVIIKVVLYQGNIKYYYGNGVGGNVIFDIPFNNDTWYHNTFLLNCITDKYTMFLNYEKKLDNVNFNNDFDFDFGVSLSVKSHLISNVMSVYLDGIDHSYSKDWNFNRSKIPESLNTEYLEVDKYEFNYDINDFENDFYIWKEFGFLSGYNDVYIDSTNDIENKVVINSTYGQVYTHGIKYDDINSNAKIINITLNMEILFDTSSYTYYHNIKFYDNLNKTHYLSYINFKTTTEMVQIYNTQTKLVDNWFNYSDNHEYIFNVYLNYYDGIMIISAIDLYDDTNYIYSSLINVSKFSGLSSIHINHSCYETTNPSGLTSTYYFIGIYENGKSLIKYNDKYEFGLMSYNINRNWNSDHHNLLTIDSENRFDLFVHNYYEYYLNGYKIREIKNQTESETFNFADKKDNNYPKFSYNNPYLIFRVNGYCNNFNEIEIEGILLIDNKGNSIFGNYYYNNTDSNSNWFYCVDNKLHYNIDNSKDYGIMRISFNVNDVLLDNESIISYTSFITNNYSGNIKLVAYEITEIFTISENDTSVSSYENITDITYFTLTSIIIEIQSNINSENIPEGYIQNINIYLDKSLFPEFEPIDYLESTFLEKILETMIPLILFIIPSLAVRTRFGYKVVLPIWILLTIVFLFTGFIPFWICFIIFLAITLMVLNKENEVLD